MHGVIGHYVHVFIDVGHLTCLRCKAINYSEYLVEASFFIKKSIPGYGFNSATLLDCRSIREFYAGSFSLGGSAAPEYVGN